MRVGGEDYLFGSSEDADIREVFAHVGLVLYLGQVLEHGIVNILVSEFMLSVKKSAPRPINKLKVAQYVEEARKLEGEHFKTTLGTLLKSLRTSGIVIPPRVDELLDLSLVNRNRIAHRFFREHAMNLANSDGRKLMLGELARIREVLDDADRELDLIATQINRELGVSEQLMADYQEFYREAALGGLTESAAEETIKNRLAKKNS